MNVSDISILDNTDYTGKECNYGSRKIILKRR